MSGIVNDLCGIVAWNELDNFTLNLNRQVFHLTGCLVRFGLFKDGDCNHFNFLFNHLIVYSFRHYVGNRVK